MWDLRYPVRNKWKSGYAPSTRHLRSCPAYLPEVSEFRNLLQPSLDLNTRPSWCPAVKTRVRIFNVAENLLRVWSCLQRFTISVCAPYACAERWISSIKVNDRAGKLVRFISPSMFRVKFTAFTVLSLETCPFSSPTPLNIETISTLRKLSIDFSGSITPTYPKDRTRTGVIPNLQWSTHLQDIELSYWLYDGAEYFRWLYDGLDHFSHSGVIDLCFPNPSLRISFLLDKFLRKKNVFRCGNASLMDTRKWFRLNKVFLFITSPKLFSDLKLPFVMSSILLNRDSKDLLRKSELQTTSREARHIKPVVLWYVFSSYSRFRGISLGLGFRPTTIYKSASNYDWAGLYI